MQPGDIFVYGEDDSYIMELIVSINEKYVTSLVQMRDRRTYIEVELIERSNWPQKIIYKIN